jgi:hypothetical protein
MTKSAEAWAHDLEDHEGCPIRTHGFHGRLRSYRPLQNASSRSSSGSTRSGDAHCIRFQRRTDTPPPVSVASIVRVRRRILASTRRWPRPRTPLSSGRVIVERTAKVPLRQAERAHQQVQQSPHFRLPFHLMSRPAREESRLTHPLLLTVRADSAETWHRRTTGWIAARRAIPFRPY